MTYIQGIVVVLARRHDRGGRHSLAEDLVDDDREGENVSGFVVGPAEHHLRRHVQEGAREPCTTIRVQSSAVLGFTAGRAPPLVPSAESPRECSDVKTHV